MIGLMRNFQEGCANRNKSVPLREPTTFKRTKKSKVKIMHPGQVGRYRYIITTKKE